MKDCKAICIKYIISILIILFLQGCPLIGGYVINSGRNWYTCYKCGYDLCVQCVHRRLDRVSRKCFLCGKRFALDTWSQGQHRRECGWRNAKILASITTCQAACKHCLSPLKIWPQSAQLSFTCHHPRHKSGRVEKYEVNGFFHFLKES